MIRRDDGIRPHDGVAVVRSAQLPPLIFVRIGTPLQAPIYALIGPQAQALIGDRKELLSVLAHVGVHERRFITHSRHTDVLLLHATKLSRTVEKYYRYALDTVMDLWRETLPTALVAQPIEIKTPGWLASKLFFGPPPPKREIVGLTNEYGDARFCGREPSDRDLAHQLCIVEQWEQAVTILRRLVEAQPDDAFLHRQLGGLLVERMHRPEQGVVHLRRAAELEPGASEYWNMLGTALAMVGEHEQASEAATREAGLEDAFETWMNAAMFSLGAAQFDRARSAVYRALGHEPDHPLPLSILAVCAREEGDEGEALRLVREAEMALHSVEPDLVPVIDDLIERARG